MRKLALVHNVGTLRLSPEDHEKLGSYILVVPDRNKEKIKAAILRVAEAIR